MRNKIIYFVLFLCSISYSQTYDKLLLNGISKYQAQDYKGAIEDYTKVIEIDAKNSRTKDERKAI